MEKVTEKISADRENDKGLEVQEHQVEDLDFWTLSFMREHIDMPEVDINPEEELKKIRDEVARTPKADQSHVRMLLMDDFKRKLKEFRTNMAHAQLDLERLLRSNPDISEDDLVREIGKIVTENHVESQDLYLMVSAKEYYRSHQDIKKVTNEFKEKYGDRWQQELFKELFGKYPEGGIQMDIMPITLYLKLSSLEDYTLAFGSLPEVARRSGGAQLNQRFSTLPELSGKILIENSSLKPTEEFIDSIKIHEEEHSIHKQLYPRTVFIKNTHSMINEFQLIPGTEIEMPIFVRMLDSYAHMLSLRFQESAQSEILAYLKNMKHISYIKEVITDPSGLYNYLEIDLDRYVKYLISHFLKNKFKAKKKNGTYMGEQELIEILSQVIKKAWQKEYLPTLDKGLEALEIIFTQYGSDPNKYSEITRLLSQEPLNKWPRLAKILS